MKHKKPENQHENLYLLRRKEWRTGTIRSKSNEMTRVLVLVAFLWNGLIGAGVYGVVNSDQQFDSINVGLLMIFGLPGLFLLYSAIVVLLQWIKFGESSFEITTKPGIIGGKLTGNI